MRADGGSTPDAAIPSILNGTELAGGHVDIDGITTDGNIVGLDQERGAAIVVPASGGDLTIVDAAADFVTLRGKVVFAFHNADFVTGIADMTVWTAASGAVPFATEATFLVAASDDGTRIFATRASSSDGTKTDLVLGGVGESDGSAPVVLRTVSRKAGCAPSVRFIESVFLFSYCSLDSTSRTVATVDPVGATVTDVLTDVGAFSVLPSSGSAPIRLLTLDSSGVLGVMPISATTSTTVATDVKSYFLLPDYSGVLVQSDAEIRRVPFDGSASTVLASSAFAAFRAISPDGELLLYSSALGKRHSYGDLLLTSTASASSPLVLDESLDGAVFGSAFTADSSRVLYFTKANDLFVGTLNSEPVGGGASIEHGSNVWTVEAYADSRVVFNDQYVPVPKRPGRATLRTVDTASSDAAAIIATHTGSTFVLNDAKDHVFFSFDDGSDKAGVYAAPLP